MQRIHGVMFTAAAAVMLIFAISACAEKAPEIPELITVLTGKTAEAELGETKLEFSVTRTEGGIFSITVASPDSLKGLSFKSLGGTYAVSYKGLSCETESSLLPDSCFAQAISSVLNKVSEENGAAYQGVSGDSAVFSGTSVSGTFTLYADSKTGEIQKIELPDLDLSITFKSS